MNLAAGTLWAANITDKLRDIRNELHEMNVKAEQIRARSL